MHDAGFQNVNLFCVNLIDLMYNSCMNFSIGEHWVGYILGMKVHMDTLITMWAAMAIIILITLAVTRKMDVIPTKSQAVFEALVGWFYSMTESTGKEGIRHTAILGSLFLFIITSNLIGQLPWKLFHLGQGELASPTNDINVTAALAVIVLIYYIGSGVAKKGIGYFKHYFQPVWFMTPFNIMEDIIRPLTLSVRLFANILAGEILILVLGGLIASLLTPEGVMAFTQNVFGGILPQGFVYNTGLLLGSFLPLPIMFFELFVAFIQALVFTLLSSAYIATATAEGH